MHKSVQITIVIVVGILVLALAGFSLLTPERTITGNGEAVIKVVPDLVTIYFNVYTSGDKLDEVSQENSKIVDDLITNLVKEGFERKDIQTQGYNVGPKYRWSNNQRIEDGYEATHSIKLEMSTENSGKIGDAVDAGISAGASINYINFELSQEKQNEYKAKAIENAAEDARIKAEALARGLNKELGKLMSVSDNDFGYYPWRIYDSAGGIAVAEEAKAATTNIQPGEQQVSARVTAVFKLK
ncbi:SIMPL domain-containing protein [Patescibacteria group bacterium]|nr:SIMPL domain-containing protein [Patescibacteria group bacterium]